MRPGTEEGVRDGDEAQPEPGPGGGVSGRPQGGLHHRQNKPKEGQATKAQTALLQVGAALPPEPTRLGDLSKSSQCEVKTFKESDGKDGDGIKEDSISIV